MSLKLSRLSLVWVSVLTVTLGVVIFPQPALAQRAIGVDVSSYQGASVNWATLKADGVSFAWAKGAEGTSTDGYVGEDPDFVTNEKNAKAAGVPIGPYYFARGLTDTGTAGADTEAAYFWSVAGSYMIADGKSIQPMLDFEVNGVASESTWVNEWCNDIVSDGKANGVVLKPLFYSDGSISSGMASSVTQWLLDIGDPSGASAQTGTPETSSSGTVSPWSTWSTWQYGGGTAGIGDGDVFNGTVAQMLTAYIIPGNGPKITTQPANFTVAPGSNVNFTISATGTGTIKYQWEFDGTNISGATASHYTVNNIQTNNAGGYSCAISDTVSNILSSGASLSIKEPWTNAPGSVVAPTGLVNWWTADHSTVDISGGVVATTQGGFSYSPGKSKTAFHFNGSTALLKTGLNDIPVPWTFCLWVNRENNTPQTSAGLLENGTNALKLEQFNGTHKVGLTVTSANNYVFSSGYIVPTNTWTHLAFVGTTAGTSLYVNGVLNGTLANSIPLPRNYIGAGSNIDFMLGSMDELMTFNTNLTVTQISAIYSTGSAGLVRGPDIGSESWLTSTHFKLNLIGLPGKTLTVDWSTNLITWTNVTAPFSNPTGNFSLTDLAAKTVQRYYRVSQQ